MKILQCHANEKPNKYSYFVAIGVWAYFWIEKLNKHSTTLELMQADLLKKAQQEPKNLEMYMLIDIMQE